jgi:hypothetical protein
MGEPTTPAELAAAFDALSRRVAALEAGSSGGWRVTLAAACPRAFLGEAVEVTARVVTGDGTPPPAGAAVTFAAVGARLRAAEGYALAAGGAVTVRSFADGTAGATVEVPLGAELWEEQRAALSGNLALLDPDAASPAAVAADLELLARLYRWESNLAFRQAVDVVFREYGGNLADPILRADPTSAWRYLDTTVVAFVHDEPAAAGSVRATAAVGVRFLDWLLPWFDAAQRIAAAEDELGGELRADVAAGGDAGRLLDGLYGRVQSFVDRQRGVVGELVGRQTAERTLRTFVDGAIAELPLETRAPLTRGLDGASRTIGQAGAAVFSGVMVARGEVRGQIAGAVGGLDATVSGLGTTVAGLGSEVSGLGSQVGEVRGSLAAKADAAALDTLRGDLGRSLATKADSAAINDLRTALDANLRMLVQRVPNFQVQRPEIFRPTQVEIPSGGPLFPGGVTHVP